MSAFPQRKSGARRREALRISAARVVQLCAASTGPLGFVLFSLLDPSYVKTSGQAGLYRANAHRPSLRIQGSATVVRVIERLQDPQFMVESN